MAESRAYTNPDWDSINKTKAESIMAERAYIEACNDYRGQIGTIKPAHILERAAYHYKMLKFFHENKDKIATTQEPQAEMKEKKIDLSNIKLGGN